MICWRRTTALLSIFDEETEKGVYLKRQDGLSQCLNRGLVISPSRRYYSCH